MKRLLLALWLILLPLLAQATLAAGEDQGAQIKEKHRAAAQHFFDSLATGAKLYGKVVQNGSEGKFEAFFYQDASLVRTTFGNLISTSYTGKEGLWSGGNHGLPYKIEPQDDPATSAMNLLADGSYMKEPYWDNFTYVGEEAGAYRFKFTPTMQVPDGPPAEDGAQKMRDLVLPPLDVLLYADPEDPEYLQVMSAEISISPKDPGSYRHRSYYYYQTDSQGRIYTKRETGRDVDQTGTEVDFVDFTVEKAEFPGTKPEELQFDFTRTPLGGDQVLAAPIEIPIDTSHGYFIVPVSFQGSDKTFNFLFDTGSSASLLSPEAATAAGLDTSLNVTGHGHGSRAEFKMGLCTTAFLGAADAAERAPMAGFTATRIPDSNKDLVEMLKHFNASGIMGIGPLYQYVIRFNFPEGKLKIFPAKGFDATASIARPNIEIWLDVEDLVMCKGRLNGYDGEVVIDTGLQQDLAIMRETMDALGLQLEKVGERNSTVLGGVKSFDYVKVPSFEIGPLAMQDKTASLTEDDQGSYSARGLLGFVGVTLFTDGPITLDLINQRMYIEPPTALGYFPGLTPPPAGKEPKDARKDDKKDGKTKLPINIGEAQDRSVG